MDRVYLTEEATRVFSIDQSKYRVIDISFPIEPGKDPDRPFDVKRGYLADNSFKFDVSKTHTHVGTHVEASAHFFDDGDTIDQCCLECFYGRGVLLNVSPVDGKYITADDVESDIGDIVRQGDIVICRSALDCRCFFTEDAARYFIRKGIKMLIFGTNVSLGESIAHTRQFHEILMRDVLFLEIVNNLEEITKREFFVMALPVLIKGMDSGWCRAVVIEER